MSPKERTNSRNEGKGTIGRILSNHTHTHTQNSKKQTRPATVEVKNNNLCMSPKERTNSRNEGKGTIGRILSNHTQTSKKQNTNATTTLCEMQNGLLKGEKSFFF